MSKNGKVIVVSLRISEELHLKLKEKAEEKKRSVNSQLLIAVEENVK